MKNIEDKIDFFFKTSTDAPSGSEFSTLYLLRRDIFTCLGYNPNSMEGINYQALWPGVMSILAGIDLLGKYLEGDDINSTVSFRFKNYYRKYFNNTEDCEIIYQLRNSMLHSFGLYSFKTKKTKNGNIKTKEYHFVLGRRNDNEIVTNGQNDWYTINIIALCNAFEISIDTYHEDLSKSESLQKNFEKMFAFYSGIRLPS